MPVVGVIFALVAMVAWTFGDFFIQRSTRRVGDVAALLAIGLFGLVVLTPIVWHEIPTVFNTGFALRILLLTLGITFVTALFEFEALRVGKLAVIEPVMSFELPLTVGIGLVLLGEQVSSTQLLLIAGIFVGVLLTVTRHEPRHLWSGWSKRSKLERGVMLAVAGAISMAIANVLTGVSSMNSSPLVTIWFIHSGLTAMCLILLLARRKIGEAVSDFRRYWKTVMAEAFFDNVAWIAYAAAVLTIPISITIAISESYVVFASLLGVMVNKEKLQRHQAIGMIVALASTVVLAAISG